ncbi:alpha/beta hydrolase [Paenibacillus sp. UASWS1643]|uniref:alpha/beta hydrolase n=1 Tax=Paenibacillus sp. UASWS1643 TaxID=2580422 RepID=UPI00123AA4B9|nr:alpha/beta hydrolase [Paenibacillus sp. UASWS1643]KAA8745375.1 alpha/beta hydrolase [Paenibacillus sp. UASWS1643]
MAKSSKHLVDPELVSLLDLTSEVELNEQSLPAIRDGYMAQIVGNAGEVRYTERFVENPKDKNEVRMLVYEPADRSEKKPLYFDIHGGGMVMGTPVMQDRANVELINELNCVIVSVDYRLAPETPHPGPIEDCYMALKWAYDHADELNIDTTRIIVGGASAGGGLAASLAILARDRGEVPIIFSDLILPMLDDRTCLSEVNEYAGEFGWTRQNNRFGWTSLLGHGPGKDGVSPYAVPARVEDMTGLPPTLIAIGALDLFVDESIDYATKLIRAGIPTELHVYPGLYHGGEKPDAHVIMQLKQDRIRALKRAFYG